MKIDRERGREEILNYVDTGIKGKNEGRLARIGERPKSEEG